MVPTLSPSALAHDALTWWEQWGPSIAPLLGALIVALVVSRAVRRSADQSDETVEHAEDVWRDITLRHAAHVAERAERSAALKALVQATSELAARHRLRAVGHHPGRQRGPTPQRRRPRSVLARARRGAPGLPDGPQHRRHLHRDRRGRRRQPGRAVVLRRPRPGRQRPDEPRAGRHAAPVPGDRGRPRARPGSSSWCAATSTWSARPCADASPPRRAPDAPAPLPRTRQAQDPSGGAPLAGSGAHTTTGIVREVRPR